MISLLFPYGEFSHGLVVSYTDWKTNERVPGGKTLEVNFEQETRVKHKVAVFTLPKKVLVYNFGFEKIELNTLIHILDKHASAIMKQANNRTD